MKSAWNGRVTDLKGSTNSFGKMNVSKLGWWYFMVLPSIKAHKTQFAIEIS